MLEIEDLEIAFGRYRGLFGRTRAVCLSGVSTRLARGEMLALVGASGAGKSLLSHAILGILPPNAEIEGRLCFDGTPLTPERQSRLRGRRIALVPQSIAHLDPLARSGRQVGWAAGRAGIARASTTPAAAGALARYGLDERTYRAFPHTLSGGMARRVMLAIATVAEADLVIADEPTCGLDADVASIVLDHLRRLADSGRAVMVVTHDVSSIVDYADRVTVLKGGATVETAPAAAFRGDGHGLTSAYAKDLWRALPQNGFTIPAGGI